MSKEQITNRITAIEIMRKPPHANINDERLTLLGSSGL